MSTKGEARPSLDDKGRLKVATPDFFDGNRNKVDHWCTQMDLYLRFNCSETKGDEKALIAASYMRGKAQDWIKPYISYYLAGDQRHQFMDSWGKLRVAVKQLYGISNDQAVAIRKVQNLRQVRSASEYAADFQEAAPKTGWNAEALKEMFKLGLKPQVRKELIRHAADISSFPELVQAAIACNDQLYEFYADMKGNWGARRGRGGGSWKNPDAMELDAIHATEPRKGKGYGKKKGGKKTTCYTCGKPGHIARNCRSKGLVPRAQLNVMRELPEEPHPGWRVSEWEASGEGLQDPPPYDEWQLAGSELLATDFEEDAVHVDPGQPELTPNGSTDEEYTPSPDTEQLLTEVADLIEEPGFAVDPRHPWHDQLHWTQCAYLWCYAHQIDKQGHPVYRLATRQCHKRWNECRDDECPEHLIDKRGRKCFPGHDGPWNQKLREGASRCQQGKWVTCVHHQCQVHKEEKLKQGFAPALEDPRQRDPEPPVPTEGPQISRERRFDWKLDVRNMYHGTLHVAHCRYTECPDHRRKIEKKWGTRWKAPGYDNICTALGWVSCRRYDCPIHLMDKREGRYFPGRSREMNALMFANSINVDSTCIEDTWQTCLKEKCRRHDGRLIQYGIKRQQQKKKQGKEGVHPRRG